MRTISNILNVLALLIGLTALGGCVNEDEYPNTPQGNFEALWKLIDEHYCFFDYKQHAYGLDWQQAYNKYNVRARGNITDYQLFEVLTDMLSELRDGHVNLYTAFDNGRYWKWHEDYPSNFSDTLQRRYLGTDYRIASALKYRILDDNIGYVTCQSFNTAMEKAISTKSSSISFSVMASSSIYAVTVAEILPMPRNSQRDSVTRKPS